MTALFTDNGALGVHVNALINAKNNQSLPFLERIADALEALNSQNTVEKVVVDPVADLRERLLALRIKTTGHQIQNNTILQNVTGV